MAITDKMTVTQFELIRMCCELDAAGNLTTFADVGLRNAAGQALGRDSVQVAWSPAEEAAIKAKVAAKKAQYAAATGWSEYTGE